MFRGPYGRVPQGPPQWRASEAEASVPGLGPSQRGPSMVDFDCTD